MQSIKLCLRVKNATICCQREGSGSACSSSDEPFFCPMFLLWAYWAMARASIASSTGARIQKCVVSENVIHLCSPAGGCQAVLLLYQLLSSERSVKTAARITAASLVDQGKQKPWEMMLIFSVISSYEKACIFPPYLLAVWWLSLFLQIKKTT